MEGLNFHHLRYFWTVARKGGVRKAAQFLNVSQPSISAQVRLLEESLGEKLFHRSGRNLVLTETGQLVMSYADEIFSTSRELMNAVRQGPETREIKLNVGVTDSISKLIAFEILKPAFNCPHPTRVICRQAEIGPLVNHLQAHRLDIVLADEPASSSFSARAHNHHLGHSAVTFCAVPSIASKLRKNFPQSLHDAPALLPSENMGIRVALETWFDAQDVKPRPVGEFEDSALMEVAASGGHGFTTVHTVVDQVALNHYGLRVIARVEECGSDFYAITTERRVKHPVVEMIAHQALTQLFA